MAAAVSVGVEEAFVGVAEFVNRAEAFAVIVKMLVRVAENKTDMGCFAPGAYIGSGQGLSEDYCALLLHNLGMRVGLQRQRCRNVSRDVRKPVTSYCFSLSRGRGYDFSIGSPIPSARVRW